VKHPLFSYFFFGRHGRNFDGNRLSIQVSKSFSASRFSVAYVLLPSGLRILHLQFGAMTEGADLPRLVPLVTATVLEAPVAAVTEMTVTGTMMTVTETETEVGIGIEREGGEAGPRREGGVLLRRKEGMIGRELRLWRIPKEMMIGLRHRPTIIEAHL
jgi:hypothetical protein